jgi:DNA-binding Xre family transcriptional regulator
MVTSNFSVLLARKEQREKKNIPISEVSRETGISRRALQQWANNTITRFDAPILSALCKYFDCKVGDLLEYVPDPEPTE